MIEDVTGAGGAIGITRVARSAADGYTIISGNQGSHITLGAMQPVSFDLVLAGVTPPFFEERNLVRNRRTGRIDVDVVRYHQGGWASGTITVAAGP